MFLLFIFFHLLLCFPYSYLLLLAVLANRIKIWRQLFPCERKLTASCKWTTSEFAALINLILKHAL